MWVAAAADAKIPGSTDPVLQQSSRVKACIAYAGPSALTDQYYSYDPSIGHGTSPVWAFLGVTTQAEWDALPDATKNYPSPRWHVTSGARPTMPTFVFLAFSRAILKITSRLSSRLRTATSTTWSRGSRPGRLAGGRRHRGDRLAGLHRLLDGRRSLRCSLRRRLARDPALRRQDANDPRRTPGCLSQEYLSANSPAKIANTNFQIRCYNALPSVIALLLVTNQVLPAPSDLLNFGFDFIIDPYSPLLLGFDMAVDSTGLGW